MAIGQSEAVMQARPALPNMERLAGPGDGELLARFIADRDEVREVAFATLVRRHGPMILRVCEQIVGDRHIAEDAFQAVFLILARKASSIHQPELLGHWLHGVALRTAREARMRNHRRRHRESSSAEGTEPELIDSAGRPEATIIGREATEALHEEIARLPERYRVPVVLCDLEGLTYQEAASRLRCPVSTVGVRLRRARERLRTRLTQRGVAPAAGMIGALVGAEYSTACLSTLIVESTVKGAMGFATKAGPPNGSVPGKVIALTEHVLRIMAFDRLKWAINLMLAVVITSAIGWVGTHQKAELRPALVQSTSLLSDQVEPAEIGGAFVPNDPGQVMEPPPFGNPVAASFAGRHPGATVAAEQPKASPALSDGLFSSSRQRELELASNSAGKTSTSLAGARANAGRASREEVARGEALFAKEWVPNDPVCRAGDGLGPVYNDTSCVACHGLGAPGGAGPESKNVVLVTAVPNNCGRLDPLDQLLPGFRGSRSAVLHRFGTEPDYASWRTHFSSPAQKAAQNAASTPGGDALQNRIRAVREQTTPGRRFQERSGNLPSRNGFILSLAERNTPALFGAGRIDDIASEVLVAVAACQPADVKGRVGRTKEGRIGRFGWKAQLPSLHEFVRGACANELGLEVPGHSQAASPVSPLNKVKGLDLTEADCDALVSYVRALPSPVVVDPAGPLGTEDMRVGRRLFGDLECTACHMPTLAEVRGIYSDLLLHDMGQSLSDSGSTYGIDGPDTPEGPKPREWRTPPLWGYRDSGPYMHDGRAQSLEEAVALHEGQGTASAHRFFSLSAGERAQVEAFLKSLVAPVAAASPGVVLASEMELRLEREERREPEDRVRQRREREVARDEQLWRDAQRHRRALEAAKRARVQIPIAQNLEKMGKFAGAMAFYREIARQAEGTDEGRLAATRIAEISSRTGDR
jgi:RNA polymerase sigma factor (sigma-70 family)